MKSLFVTGTDTDVGKTVATALLVCHLQNRGIDVGVMKPFATGCVRVDGELQSSDAIFLRAATGVNDELELINPCRWEEPLAPMVAARRAGNQNWDALGACESAYRELAQRHECVVVEGVGGWLVPLQEKRVADYLQRVIKRRPSTALESGMRDRRAARFGHDQSYAVDLWGCGEKRALSGFDFLRRAAD